MMNALPDNKAISGITNIPDISDIPDISAGVIYVEYTTMRISQDNLTKLKDVMYDQRLETIDDALKYLIENRPVGHEAEDVDYLGQLNAIQAIDRKVELILELVNANQVVKVAPAAPKPTRKTTKK